MKKESEEQVSPIRAKLVLTIFGQGPLVLMAIFLTSNGFFQSPGS